MIILLHMVIIWQLDDDDEGGGEEERQLIDLQLASTRVKMEKNWENTMKLSITSIFSPRRSESSRRTRGSPCWCHDPFLRRGSFGSRRSLRYVLPTCWNFGRPMNSDLTSTQHRLTDLRWVENNWIISCRYWFFHFVYTNSGISNLLTMIYLTSVTL